MKILVDNGHGVTTRSKQSPDGRLREYRYARETAREVVRRLKAQGYDAELLVSEEADLSVGERALRANAWCDRLGAKNVLLVSIHTNAAPGEGWRTARGWEAWTSKGQTRGDILAEHLYRAAASALPGMAIRRDTSDGDSDKEEDFTILRRTRCAACLTENLFHNNREDVDFLLSAEGRAAIITLHVEGIKAYVAKSAKKNI